MGLHREIEKILARPTDSLLLREIIALWGKHRSERLTAEQIAEKLNRPVSKVASLMRELARLDVLRGEDDEAGVVYSYLLRGAEAFEFERFAHSKSFHERKLIRSTDRFRAMYQRKPSE